MTGPDIRAAVAALDSTIKDAMLARAALLGETSEPLPPANTAAGSEPRQCGVINAGLGFECDRAQGHDGPHLAHTWDREPLASWAQPRPFCVVQNTDGALCTRPRGHDGDHASRGMHTRWPRIEPACDCLAENPGPRTGGAILGCPKHDPERTGERRAALAPPSGCSLPSIEVPTGGAA